jgi:hypothetical protein
LGTCSRIPGAVRGLRLVYTGSAPSCSDNRRMHLSTLQASLHAADRPLAHLSSKGFVTPLRQRNLFRRREIATEDPGVSSDRTFTGWPT